jgi:glutamyl-tRNA reductase
MKLLLIGSNHKTAPAQVRDQLFMEPDEIRNLLPRIGDTGGAISETVVLSTCNRTELYGVVRDVRAAGRDLRSTISAFKGVGHMNDERYTYEMTDREAARHLFLVASGLDSLMVGEPQILGQVKDAFAIAAEDAFTGPLLTKLFQSATHVGKRARSETDIGRGAVSVAYAAVGMATKVFADLSRHQVLLIGAGETGALAGKHFADENPAGLMVANRTFERAESLAAELGGTAVSFDDLDDAIARADVVVTATSATEPVVGLDLMARARRKRGRRPLVIVDIASPRDVEPKVGQLANVFLYDLDALESIVQQNLALRAKEVPRAERIVNEEVARFFEWHDALEVAPMIKALRDTFREIGLAEAARQARHFSSDDREQLEKYTQSLLNKLLHHPTVRIREVDRSTTEGLRVLETARSLFDLDAGRFVGGSSKADEESAGQGEEEGS